MSIEVTFLPDGKKVSVRPGVTLLDAARRARVNIRTRCGGKAGCLMCKVIVSSAGGLVPMNQNEQLKLGTLEAQGYRLACQAKVIGDVTALVPEDPLKAAIRAQLQKQKQEEDFF